MSKYNDTGRTRISSRLLFLLLSQKGLFTTGGGYRAQSIADW